MLAYIPAQHSNADYQPAEINGQVVTDKDNHTNGNKAPLPAKKIANLVGKQYRRSEPPYEGNDSRKDYCYEYPGNNFSHFIFLQFL